VTTPSVEQPSPEDLIVDPVFGYRLRLSHQGEVLRGEFWVDPGGGGNIEHLHPHTEERFEIITGQVAFRLDGRSQTAGPGERATVPRGVPHTFENIGEDEAHLVVEMEPALGLAEVFREVAAMARARKHRRLGRIGVPTSVSAALEMAELLDRHRETIVLTFPPRRLQPFLLRPIARLARRRERRR
jgi:quercetin dioxygenase-like cupin family protein